MPNRSARTLVTFLLDRTGSMEAIRDDTIGGFNTYLDTLQGDGGANIEFTLVQFNSMSIDKICVAAPIAHVHKLNRDTYQPARIDTAHRRRLQDHRGGRGFAPHPAGREDRHLHSDRWA